MPPRKFAAFVVCAAELAARPDSSARECVLYHDHDRIRSEYYVAHGGEERSPFKYAIRHASSSVTPQELIRVFAAICELTSFEVNTAWEPGYVLRYLSDAAERTNSSMTAQEAMLMLKAFQNILLKYIGEELVLEEGCAAEVAVLRALQRTGSNLPLGDIVCALEQLACYEGTAHIRRVGLP
jgi:hypothetical protein